MTGCWCVLLDHGTTRTKSRLGSRLNSSMFWRVTTLSQSSLSTSQTGQKKSSFIPGKAYKNNLDSLIQSLSFTIESSNRFGGHPLSNYAKGRGEGGLKMCNTLNLGYKGHWNLAELVLTLILLTILTSFDPKPDPYF